MAPTYRRTYGNQVVTLVGYDQGMQRLIADSMMHKGLKPIAEAIKQRASSTAPRRKKKVEDGDDEAGKSYASSFRVETGVERGKKTRYRRAYARVVNDKDYAFYLEYGSQYMTARRTLRKAAGINRFDAKGDKYG